MVILIINLNLGVILRRQYIIRSIYDHIIILFNKRTMIIIIHFLIRVSAISLWSIFNIWGLDLSKWRWLIIFNLLNSSVLISIFNFSIIPKIIRFILRLALKIELVLSVIIIIRLILVIPTLVVLVIIISILVVLVIETSIIIV